MKLVLSLILIFSSGHLFADTQYLSFEMVNENKAEIRYSDTCSNGSNSADTSALNKFIQSTENNN